MKAYLPGTQKSFSMILFLAGLILIWISLSPLVMADDTSTTTEETEVVDNDSLTDLEDDADTTTDEEETDTEEVTSTLPEGRAITTYFPSSQEYELYDGILALWGVEDMDEQPLIANASDTNIEIILTWLDMIQTAHIANRSVKVQYYTETGKIISVYGFKK